MTAPTAPVVLSEHCALASRFGYGGLHADCRQTRDIPLPHSDGIVLVPRCGCRCHASAARAA
ncbi:hypothetical protein [Streptomyces sp. YIM S03343]